MNQNPLNSIYKNPDYSNGLQQQITDVIQANNQVHYNNLDTFYNHTGSFSMNNNNIPSVNALNTAGSTFQYTSNTPQYDNCNTNGLPPYSVNPPNATFNSSPPQIIHKFEIPGFEIEMIIRPKSNPIMNLSNLDTQYQPPSMNTYYVSSVGGTSASVSSANSVNTMNAMGTMNTVRNTVNTINMDNSQFQFQQQNSLGFNNFHG